MDADRSPWGPAVIAAVFAIIAVSAVVSYADAPGVWIVVGLAGLVAAWQASTAVRRHLEARDTDESDG